MDVANGSATNTFCAWISWYPFPEIIVPNFSITPGQSIAVAVHFLTTLALTPPQGVAGFILVNLNSGEYFKGALVSAPLFTLAGDSAEWIVERAKFNGRLARLANYGRVDFTEASALNSNNVAASPDGGQSLDMEDDYGDIVSAELHAPAWQCRYLC